MKYYMSNGEYYDYFTGNTVLPGELITKRERNSKFRYLCDNCFTLVKVNKKDTYFSFGARYAYYDAKVSVLTNGLLCN